MVVLAMLTLFALVGVTFVLMADSAARSARLARQSESQFRPDIDPEAALALALGQLLYDVNDDAPGIYSALRGHSLARNLYGWNQDTTVPLDKPHTGFGRVHRTGVMGFGGAYDDEAYLMNFQYFAGDNLRDPERATARSGPGAARGRWVGGYNVPYTYPDHNNFFLAQINPRTGEVMVPSFHRDYLFGRLDLPNGPLPRGNPNWGSPIGKYLTLRPHPLVHPNFPPPLDAGGDVKNLDDAPGGADSIWIDIGAPVMTRPDNGKKYKMLVAPLILDLGGRLDLNAVGNILGKDHVTPDPLERTQTDAPVSNQGWGPWEINLRRLLSEEEEIHPAVPPSDPTYPAFLTSVNHFRTMQDDFRRISTGRTAANTLLEPRGRYNQHPTSTTATPAPPPGGWTLTGPTGRAWSLVDFNGKYEPAANREVGPNLILPGGTWPGAAGTRKPYFIEPHFIPQAYGNGGTGVETTNHPALYNVYRPQAPNLRLPVAGMAQLLRWGGSGSEMQTSDLLRLANATLNSGNQPRSRRNMVTLLSADLDRIAPVPYIWNPADATRRLQLPTTGLAPAPVAAGNIPFPTPPLGGAVPTGSEFDPTTWQSTLAQLGKINLNRKLTDYPPVDANGLFLQDTPARQAALANAIQDRQNFAKELYDLLRTVTGASDPNVVRGDLNRVAEYNALRWLAQLAVNIVDYIDSDGYSTAFGWDPGNPQEYVFGVELPRLVLNEVYAQYDNNADPNQLIPDGMGSFKVRPGGNYRVNVWVELHNPVPEDGRSDCIAQLHNGTDPVYTIALAQVGLNTAGILRAPGNTKGDPDFGLAPGSTQLKSTFKDWGAQNKVLPFPNTTNGRFSTSAGNHIGFYVVGPPATSHYPARISAAKPNFQAITTASPAWVAGAANASMSYDIGANDTRPTPPHPTILLRRLANPGLPYNNTPGNPRYNPYITVDFLEFRNQQPDLGQVNDCRMFNLTGPIANRPPAQTARSAWGRPQPFAGAAALRRPQPAAAGNRPANTFYRHNSTAPNRAALEAVPTNGDPTLTVPFDWLVHLDRQLISPMELWHVARCKPHELTEAFITNTANINSGQANKHVVQWTEPGRLTPGTPQNRLYRFFECVETPPRGYGTAAGGRVPGRVNINAVWNGEILRALADPQVPRPSGLSNSFFTQNDVDTISLRLFANRSTNSPRGSITRHGHTLHWATGYVGPTDAQILSLPNLPAPRFGTRWQQDKPFWSLGVGPADGSYGTIVDALSATPRGRDSTILRDYTTNRPLFDPDSAGALNSTTHPYLRKQLLTKIYNHLTTRSNVFAVWLTVGFFEVDDQGQLGAEINKVENRQIRHRLFAIVDRSQMTLHQQTLANSTGSTVWTPGNPAIVTLGIGQDPRSGRTWNPPPGTLLTLDEGQPNEETVQVSRTISGTTVTFTVNQTHGRDPAGNALPITIRWRGNPGPWTQQKYDPRLDTDVVPFFSVID
jgi:hypothetical protein